jgi:hypothetical protein
MCDRTGHRNCSRTDDEGKKYAEPESNNARLCSADRIRRELRFLNPSSARKRLVAFLLAETIAAPRGRYRARSGTDRGRGAARSVEHSERRWRAPARTRGARRRAQRVPVRLYSAAGATREHARRVAAGVRYRDPRGNRPRKRRFADSALPAGACPLLLQRAQVRLTAHPFSEWPSILPVPEEVLRQARSSTRTNAPVPFQHAVGIKTADHPTLTAN